MKIGVFSDLHILSEQDPFYQVLLRTLLGHFEKGDRVVLAGDIFDLFVGGKDVFRFRYQAFFNALGKMTQNGVSISVIDGNHDFYFSKAIPAGAIEIQDSAVTFEEGGRKFYIAHGDLVDPEDRAYLFMRKILRSPLGRGALRVLPEKLLDRIGQRVSDYGKSTRPSLPQDWPQAERDRLRSKFHSFARGRIAAGYDYVVLGHCHDLDEAQIAVGSRVGQYANVGFPKIHNKYLLWTSACQKFVREDFNFQ